MRGGNNIKSTKEKQLSGTSRADRDEGRLENNVPTLSIVPDPPRGWDAEHKKKWREVAGIVCEMKILTTADLKALEMMVRMMIQADKAYESLAAGVIITVVTSRGSKEVINPAFRVYEAALKVLKPLYEQFGMTPKSRQGLKVTDAEEADPIQELLKSRRTPGASPHD